jgi:uncharacterized membrane protein
MNLNKNVFITIVAVMLVLYGVVNATLWYKRGESSYFESDLFIIITSIFFFMILLILPRTVAILLGSESQAPKSEIHDKEISDSEYGS